MDTLCLKTGIHGGLGSSISACSGGGGSLDARATPSQVSAVGRSTAERKAAPFLRFPFKYPLRSLWPSKKVDGNNRYNGLAVDDAVLMENTTVKKISEGMVGLQEEEGDEGQREENWVLKILHLRSLWKERSADLADVEKEDEGPVAIDQRVGADGKDDDEDCDVCRVGDNDDEKEEIQFDRDSFSRLLRRVSLAEARLYAQMSYLGNLAYSIPNIKVPTFFFFFFVIESFVVSLILIAL